MFGKTLKMLIILHLFNRLASIKYILSNPKCKTFDAEFAEIDLCELRPDRRNVPRLFVTVRMLKGPIQSCTMGVVSRFASSTSIPMVNNSWDLCAYFKNPKKFLAFGRLFKYFASYSNLNQSCPYNQDFIIRNFTFTGRPLIPVPNSRIVVQTDFTLNKKHRFAVGFTFDIEN